MNEFWTLWLPCGLAFLAAAIAIVGLILDDSDPIGWDGRCFWCGRKHK